MSTDRHKIRLVGRGFQRATAAEEAIAASNVRRVADMLLARPRIVCRGNGARDEIALTFDDGPSQWTARIAASLESHGCRSTFFLRGPAARERPNDAAALVACGHELGNHLWSHNDATTLSRAELRTEVIRTADVIYQITGTRPTLIRPPYLKGPREVANAARRSGAQAIVQRSVSVSDWAATSAEDIFEPLLNGVRAGDIVCLHDGVSPGENDTDSREPTAEAVEQILPILLKQGLRPVTIHELLS